MNLTSEQAVNDQLTILELQRQLEEANQHNLQNQAQLEYISFVASVALRETTQTRIIAQFIKRTALFLHADWAVYLPLKNEDTPAQVYVHDTAKQHPELKKLTSQNVNLSLLKRELSPNEGECGLISPAVIQHNELSFELVLAFPITIDSTLYGCILFCLNQQNEPILNQIARIQSIESVRTLLADAVRRKMTEDLLQNRVSELHASNKALEDTQKQLLRSERMASIGQLAAGVAHEINNPVGYVSSNLETLKDYLKLIDQVSQQTIQLTELTDPSQLTASIKQLANLLVANEFDYVMQDCKAIISDTNKGINRIKDIVSGLKTFSHISDNANQIFSVGECIKEALAVCWNQLKYKIEVVEYVDMHPLIEGNKGQIEQVLVNLFINALHAMEANGGTLTIISYQQDNLVKISITDTGCGIAEQDLSKIFDPFYTSKPVGVGTGLGLSISQNIISKHAGKMNFKSMLGHGTCITISLPAVTNP